MNRSVLMQNQLAGKSVKQKCFDVLKDLETTYIDLSTGHKWNVTSQSTSVFPASADLTRNIYTMNAGKDRIPYDEWLKNCTCHNCGLKGHIPSKCPSKPKDGYKNCVKDTRPPYDRNKWYEHRGRRDQRGQSKQNERRSNKNHDDRRFKKAYKAVIETFNRDSSSDEESDASASPRESVSDTVNDSDSDGSDCSLAAHAARMFKSLPD